MAALPSQVTEATPESASLTNPVTLVEVPVKTAPEAGDVMETVGGVLSRLTTSFAVAVFPALSIAVPVTNWLAP